MTAWTSHSPTPRSVQATQALQEFIDDEMLRAPMLFDQLMDNTAGLLRRDMPQMPMSLRTGVADLLQAMGSRHDVLARAFLNNLSQLATSELSPSSSLGSRLAPARPSLALAQSADLSLVDENEVAVDVELAHTVERIKSEAESELRELQTYTAALVGDMDLSGDHNPFRAETYARALWAAAQALPLSRGFQVQFVRHATAPLAALLRQSYAAATSRLDMQGIEPAAYRTVILPSGARSSRSVESSFSPNLQQVSQTLSTIAPALRADTVAGTATQVSSARALKAATHRGQPHPRPSAVQTDPAKNRAARQRAPDSEARALVAGLFEVIRQDERVPADVLVLIMRLHGPAVQLAQTDAQALIDEAHPLWAFINRLAYEAEMVPDAADPERGKLLRTAQATVDHLSAEPRQTAALYIWGAHTLDVLMNQRLARRCQAVASQISAMQKLEDQLRFDDAATTTQSSALDTPNLDTVPADLMPKTQLKQSLPAQHWLDERKPGDRLRLILQGRWVQAQVLWVGARREVWLLGDGASDETWAMRHRALLKLFEAGLLKGLTQRSLVGRAARALHDSRVSQAA